MYVRVHITHIHKTGCTCISVEKEMATHYSILAWRILWTGEPGGLLSRGSHRVGHDWSNLAFMHVCIGKGNGNPLQCSCLENPRDRGAWWAAIYGVAQSRTWLKQLSMHSMHASVCVHTHRYIINKSNFSNYGKQSFYPWNFNLVHREYFFPRIFSN